MRRVVTQLQDFVVDLQFGVVRRIIRVVVDVLPSFFIVVLVGRRRFDDAAGRLHLDRRKIGQRSRGSIGVVDLRRRLRRFFAHRFSVCRVGVALDQDRRVQIGEGLADAPTGHPGRRGLPTPPADVSPHTGGAADHPSAGDQQGVIGHHQRTGRRGHQRHDPRPDPREVIGQVERRHRTQPPAPADRRRQIRHDRTQRTRQKMPRGRQRQ